ncbi:gliding-motility protein MglA [Candidatus Fermentibacteria bacterium]|nr:gliding-motility protein MglA [Candidatus Fermentibacteria bacterium]
MSTINFATREINFKIVYYGPGMSGKTTNLVYMYSRLTDDRKGQLITLDTEQERTLFFDFFPLELGEIQGFKTRFHLYTVPGQVYYEASRRIVLSGADGVVFVADSQASRRPDNVESLRGMLENMASYGLQPGPVPVVLQYNKRDMDGILTVEDLDADLRADSWPRFASVATQGAGVLDTVRTVMKEVLSRFE